MPGHGKAQGLLLTRRQTNATTHRAHRFAPEGSGLRRRSLSFGQAFEHQRLHRAVLTGQPVQQRASPVVLGAVQQGERHVPVALQGGWIGVAGGVRMAAQYQRTRLPRHRVAPQPLARLVVIAADLVLQPTGQMRRYRRLAAVRDDVFHYRHGQGGVLLIQGNEGGEGRQGHCGGTACIQVANATDGIAALKTHIGESSGVQASRLRPFATLHLQCEALVERRADRHRLRVVVASRINGFVRAAAAFEQVPMPKAAIAA